MLTRRHCLGIYVSCNGKCSAIYRSILLHNDSLWISAIIFLILLLITEGKTSLRLEKEHFLYSFTGQSVSRGMVFSFSTDNNLPGFRSNPCAMIQSLMPLIALSLQWITKNRRPQNYTFLCMFVALLGVMLVISKGNIELLFGASHLSTNILMLCGVTCWVIYTNGVLVFNLGHHRYDINLFIWLHFTHRYCYFLNVHNIVTMPSLRTVVSVRFELFYMSIIAGVIAILLEYGKSLYFIY